MRINCFFTTYRREDNSTERRYSSTATLTNVGGFITPASAEMSAVLGIDYATRPYIIQTDEQNFEKYDKIVIAFPTDLADTYYVDGIEKQFVNGISKTRLLLRKDE